MSSTTPVPPKNLLAVDVGLRTGLAFYDHEGCLLWYRSRHFGSPTHLRRGIIAILNNLPELSWLILEGGGILADIWKSEAKRRKLNFQGINAEQWRQQLLYPREQRHGPEAKKHADYLARRVIDWAGAPRPLPCAMMPPKPFLSASGVPSMWDCFRKFPRISGTDYRQTTTNFPVTMLHLTKMGLYPQPKRNFPGCSGMALAHSKVIHLQPP